MRLRWIYHRVRRNLAGGVVNPFAGRGKILQNRESSPLHKWGCRPSIRSKNRTRSTRLYERTHSNFYQTRKTANAKGDLMYAFPNTTFVDNHAHVRIIRQNLMVVFSSPPHASGFAILRDPPPRVPDARLRNHLMHGLAASLLNPTFTYTRVV